MTEKQDHDRREAKLKNLLESIKAEFEEEVKRAYDRGWNECAKKAKRNDLEVKEKYVLQDSRLF